MKPFELRARKYTLRDFLAIPFRAFPALFPVRILYNTLGGLNRTLTALATAAFVDGAIAVFGGAPRETLVLPLATILALLFYNACAHYLMALGDTAWMMRLERSFRTETLQKRARLEYRHIENNDDWDLIARVCKNPHERVNEGFCDLISIYSLALNIGSILVLLFTQVWWAALAIVAVAVPLLLLSIKAGKATYAANKEAEKHRRRADYLDKLLTGRDAVEERTLFGFTPAVGSDWHAKFEVARKVEFKTDAKYFLRMKGSSVLTVLLALAIVSVLVFAVSTGELSVGMFMGLATAAFELVQSLSWSLPYDAERLVKNREYMKDLTAFAAMSETPDADVLPAPGFSLTEPIVFDRVTFAYPGTDRPILRELSLTLEPGRHYAIVGVNGAGKTTLTKLLTGLYDTYEGAIRVGGRELRDFPMAERKAMFAVTFQDFARYGISLGDNIALGDANALDPRDDARVREAVERIGLDGQAAELPNGLDTPLLKIREGGVDLSGGQWQRVALARTLYSRAPVTILDEPTAALDPVAESRVYELFGRISAGRTTVFVTHRLGAARLADEIVVLDDGKVVEQGPHDALVAQDGLYAKMFDAQRSWYVEKEAAV